MFRRGAITVLKVAGVPIRLHFSVLLLIPFLAYVLAAQAGLVAQVARIDPAALTLPPWAWGVIASAGLLVSITLHELAHTLVAIKHGGRVESIVLMALGGVSQVAQMPKRPRHELEMAVVGPLTSLLLAAVFGGGWGLTYQTLPNVAFALFVLAYLNLVLAVFNLLPAFPMDGGRVLRAALAARFGKQKATRIAAGVGRGMALLFGLWGLLGGGVFLLLIAFFVWAGAGQELIHANVQHALGDLQVGEVKHTVPAIQAGASLEDARMLLRDEGSDSAVVLRDGETIGVLRKGDFLEMPLQERLAAKVEDHMLHTQAVQSGEELRDSFDRVLRDGEVPVIDPAGHPAGVVRAADVLGKLQERGFKLPGDR